MLYPVSKIDKQITNKDFSLYFTPKAIYIYKLNRRYVVKCPNTFEALVIMHWIVTCTFNERRSIVNKR